MSTQKFSSILVTNTINAKEAFIKSLFVESGSQQINIVEHVQERLDGIAKTQNDLKAGIDMIASMTRELNELKDSIKHAPKAEEGQRGPQGVPGQAGLQGKPGQRGLRGPAGTFSGKLSDVSDVDAKASIPDGAVLTWSAATKSWTASLPTPTNAAATTTTTTTTKAKSDDANKKTDGVKTKAKAKAVLVVSDK